MWFPALFPTSGVTSPHRVQEMHVDEESVAFARKIVLPFPSNKTLRVRFSVFTDHHQIGRPEAVDPANNEIYALKVLRRPLIFPRIVTLCYFRLIDI